MCGDQLEGKMGFSQIPHDNDGYCCIPLTMSYAATCSTVK